MTDPLRRLEGKYEILRKLGEGGMGAVYHVRHRLLGDERVVKVMRPHLGALPSPRQRFEREARAASRLRHPGIAQLYDFTIDDQGFAYIAMECIHGMTLETLIDRLGRPPLALGLEIARQSLEAIGYLHAHGMVHRDIAPDNLMLTRDFEGAPQVKLIDLGIAKSLENGTTTLTARGMFVGKVRYAAPEQFDCLGERPLAGREVGPPCDLYSFGLVLYELLTGQFPIAGDNPTSIIAGHLFRPPLAFAVTDPDGTIPEPVRAAVLQVLEKDPGARFADAASMATALAPARQAGDLATPEVERFLALTRGDAPPAAPSPTDESERTTERFEARDLVRQARGASDRGEYGAALELLREAMRMAPEDEQVQVLLRDTEKAVRRSEAERRRNALVAARAAEISQLLAAGEVDQARRALHEAGECFGKHVRLRELRQRLDELVAGDRRGHADQWVARARVLSQSEEFTQAQEAVRQAVALDPNHHEARTLSHSIDTLLTLQHQQVGAQSDLSDEIAAIRKLLSAARPGEALKRLTEAIGRFGDDPQLQALRYETAQAFLETEEPRYGGDEAAPAAPPPPPPPPSEQPTVLLAGPPPPAAADPGYREATPAPPSAGAVAAPQVPPPPPVASPPWPAARRQADLTLDAPVPDAPAPVSIDDLPLAGMGIAGPTPAGPGRSDLRPQAPAADLAPSELGFRGDPLTPDPEPFVATLPPPRPFPDFSSLRTWLLVGAVIIVVFLLGLWLAGGGSDSPPEPEPEIEVQDVEAPRY